MSAQERTEAARQAILSAACDVIAEAGLENVRMRMVAERAGVSTALLHYHFANRDTLFLAALKYSFANAGAALYNAQPPTDRPHTWALTQIIEACLPVPGELRRDFLLWQELTLRATRHADSAEAAVSLYHELAEWIAEAVRAGIKAGEFNPARPDQALSGQAWSDATKSDPASLDAAEAVARATAHQVIALTQGYGSAMLLGDAVLTLDAAREAVWCAVSRSLGLPLAV